MKKKLLCALALTLMVTALFTPRVQASGSEDIVLLYTNDVHCGFYQERSEDGTAVEHLGYDGVAAYKKEMESLYGASRVTMVDAGDAIQGEAVGTLSEGAYAVEVMGRAGYDFAIPGNHEFDYGVDTLIALSKQAKYEYLCCNFLNQEGKPVFKPYAIVDYGDAKVAYVGISTPESFTKSTPAYFQDQTGTYIYSFCEGEGELYAAVQSAVNSAKAEGADYVAAIAHLGEEGSTTAWRSDAVIANTTGIDMMLDAHSHEQYSQRVKNKDGNEVPLLQTGTKLAALGKVVIDPASGEITCGLVENYGKTDTEVSAYLQEVKKEFEGVLQQEVAYTNVALTIQNPVTGERAVRNAETNLGDLCADAYRLMLGADVTLLNAGGIRADIDAGPITYEEIINVNPYGNQLCLAEVTGQHLLDALELSAARYPQESGAFLQVSGLTYTIDATIPSSVVLSDKMEFIRVDGLRRVKHVEIGGQPLEPGKTYRLATHDYMLKNGGDGYTMFKECPIIRDEVMLDNQALIRYIGEQLGGTVGEAYAAPGGQGRITILSAALQSAA